MVKTFQKWCSERQTTRWN